MCRPWLCARKRKTLTIRGLMLCVVLLVPALLLAQGFRGSIRGSVRDANGALLPGAKIRAKSGDTGCVRETTSGADGR